MPHQLTTIIERDDDLYVSLCPQLDIASQGGTVEQARNNLLETIELFFEAASEVEIKQRLKSEVYITQLERPAQGIIIKNPTDRNPLGVLINQDEF